MKRVNQYIKNRIESIDYDYYCIRKREDESNILLYLHKLIQFFVSNYNDTIENNNGNELQGMISS